MIRFLLPALAVTVLGACTWVKMEPQGQAVRVAVEAEDLSYCTRRGEVVVSVRDRVGFYDRNDLKVRDELEVLARNEAPRMQADTLQALGDPFQGEQRFNAYGCRGSNAPAAVSSDPARRGQPDAVQTFPLRDD